MKSIFILILFSIMMLSFNSCNYPTGSGGTDNNNLSDINFNINVLHNIPTGSGGIDKDGILTLDNLKKGNVEIVFGKSNDNSFIPKSVIDSKDFTKSIFDTFQSKISINDNSELIKPLNSFLYQLTIKDKSYLFSVNKDQIVNKSYNLTISGLSEKTALSIKLIPITGDIKKDANNRFFKPEINENKIKNISFIVDKEKDIKKTEIIKVAIPESLPIQKRNINPCPKYCNDDSTFISDVTYPDNTIVKPNEEIKKIWAIQNSSINGVVWKNRLLKKVQDQIGGVNQKDISLSDFYLKANQDVINVPTTYPGQIILLEVNLVAPKYPVPVVRSTWKFFDEFNELVFPCLHGIYVQLNVQNENHLTNIYSDSDFEIIQSPKKENVITGQKNIQKIWKIKNISKEKWVNRRLININEPIKAQLPNEIPSSGDKKDNIINYFENAGYLKPKEKTILIPDTAPDGEAQITVEVDAPNIPADYITSSWKMIDSDGKYIFDDIEDLSFELVVKQPNNISSEQNNSSCVK